MDTIRFGLGVRALRRRRRWTQSALAVRASLSRSAIARIERGQADRFTVRALGRVCQALDARMDVRLLWHAEGLDRLLDRGHADLVDRMIGLLTTLGWTAAAEVSFSIRGERGSVDVLAFHTTTRALLVVEVKTVVPDVQAMLVALDRKGRLGREIAHARGWPATSVTRLLVLPDDRTARRRVDAYATTFRSALPARTVEVRRWLRNPAGASHGILFLSDATQAGIRRREELRRSGPPLTVPG